jgi:hypothetical protein
LTTFFCFASTEVVTTFFVSFLFCSDYVFTNKTANAELILIDFGEALHIKENESCEEGVGTPFYTAPEIFDADFTEPHTGKVHLILQNIIQI